VHVTVAIAPRDPHRVPIGAVRQWRFPSSRRPDVVYTVTLGGDNGWECDCPGYQHGRRSDRLCRHIDQARDETRAPDLSELLAAL
jgi:SWIM zinc finger